MKSKEAVINSQSLLSEEISWHWSVMEFLEQAPVSAILFLLPENSVITAVKEWNPFFHEKKAVIRRTYGTSRSQRL